MLVKILAGTVIGGIVMWLLGFLIFGVIFDSYMKPGVHKYPGLIKESPEMISLFLFNLSLASSIDPQLNSSNFGISPLKNMHF